MSSDNMNMLVCTIHEGREDGRSYTGTVTLLREYGAAQCSENKRAKYVFANHGLNDYS